MKAIYTKYIGQTNTKGTRIKSFTLDGHSVSIPYPYELSHEAAHYEAVKALVLKYKMDWNIRDMRFGDAPGGYVFCFADSVVQS